jgi:serine/threonine protein kinase
MQAAEVAGALAYLHSMHVVHADLTGNNILLSPSEQDSRGFTAQVGGWLGV